MCLSMNILSHFFFGALQYLMETEIIHSIKVVKIINDIMKYLQQL